MKAFVYRQSIKDRAVAEASLILSNVTGLSRATWRTILEWRVKYYRGNLARALKARTTDGEVVFTWPE